MRPCHFVWDGVTIDRFGQVTPCCLLKPGVVGSIYDSPLAEIVNSSVSRRFREEALQGRLSCQPACHLLAEEEAKPASLDERIDYRELRHLHLGFGDACNIDCIMCRRARGDATALSAEALVRNVDLSPFTEIAIQGGEPLVIHECLTYLGHLAEQGKRYILLTNGLLIDEGRATDLASHAAKVVISLNGATRDVHEHVNAGSRWDRVLANVARLRSARDAMDSPMELVCRITMVPENLDDVPGALRSFREWGFDSINFGFDRRSVPAILRARRELTAALRLQIREALQGTEPARVDAHRLRILGLA